MNQGTNFIAWLLTHLCTLSANNEEAGQWRCIEWTICCQQSWQSGQAYTCSFEKMISTAFRNLHSAYCCMIARCSNVPNVDARMVCIGARFSASMSLIGELLLAPSKLSLHTSFNEQWIMPLILASCSHFFRRIVKTLANASQFICIHRIKMSEHISCA